MTKHLTWIAAAALVVTLGACTEHKIYRSDLSLCTSADPNDDWSNRCRTNALQTFETTGAGQETYSLGFIEFDDQGQLWNRKQMDEVVTAASGQSVDKDVLMIVFVHGWKHSASPGDSNITDFRRILRRVSAMESRYAADTGNPARTVFGVYLGWWGGSVTVLGVKELTFWDRKATAEKVGHGGVAEVLSRLELVRMTKNSKATSGNAGSRSRLVIVGHSFGGAVVYSSVAQLLEERFVLGPLASKGAVGNTRGFGDLVVLVNPAFEANLYTPLSDMSLQRATYFSTQKPVLAVLTSEADEATRKLFPIGRAFNTVFELHRSIDRYNPIIRQDETIDEKQSNTTAVGHYVPYRTHKLRAADGEAGVGTLTVDEELSIAGKVRDSWRDDRPGSRIPFFGSVLERTANSAGRNPYLVIQVDKALIPNHNDIYDPRITSFIRQLIFLFVD